jgi:substrate import-associated zinc metallohydrolase lipoprotein
MALAAVSLGACSEEGLEPDSIFGPEPGVVENAFDAWLYTNYTRPYNITFKYRLEDRETDPQYNLVPADYTKSIALAKMTQHVWIDSYIELIDSTFIRTYCPKVLFLVGSLGYNDGEVVLGTAEGGMKIVLYNVNAIDPDNLNLEMLNYYFFHTMHHEFAHILHQTKSYSTDFNLISPADYTSGSWVNVGSQQALDMGFITPYGSSEPQEDFVEIFSTYVTRTAGYWNSLVGSAGAMGQSKINQKLEIVRDYMLTTWGIDMDVLREIVLRRSNEVLTMNDLTTLN